MATVNEKMTAIADNIRSKTGETKALTLDDMASGINDVFEVGMQKGNEEFWRGYQERMGADSLSTADNVYAFAGPNWNDKTFYPKFDIKPKRGQYLFAEFNRAGTEPLDLSKRLEECGVVLDTSNLTSTAYMFSYANVDNIPTIDARGASLNLAYTFRNCKTTKIRELIIKALNRYNATFSGCTNLVDIKITGTIGNNGFNMSSCTLLSASSILSVLQACNKTSANISITLPKKCIDKNTDTLTLIEADSELYSAYTAALENSYTVTFA